MQVWKIGWTDENGVRQSRYRGSKHAALSRHKRARREEKMAEVEQIEVPVSRFGLIDFLNSEMDKNQAFSDFSKEKCDNE